MADISIGWMLCFLMFYITEVVYIGAVYFALMIIMLTMEFFRQMRVEMEDFVTLHRSTLVRGIQINPFLNKWTQRYEMLSQLIECTNRCFGLLFLQTVVYLYIAVVIESFFIYVCIVVAREPLGSIIYVYSIIKFLFYLFVIGYYPSLIVEEVK